MTQTETDDTALSTDTLETLIFAAETLEVVDLQQGVLTSPELSDIQHARETAEEVLADE